MGGFFAAVLSWFLGAFTRLFAVMAANVLATKVILVTLFMVVLPIIINNVIYDLMDVVFSATTSWASSNTTSLQSTATFTGLGGYLAEELGIIDAFSVVLSAMGIRFAMSWIPFVGPK